MLRININFKTKHHVVYYIMDHELIYWCRVYNSNETHTNLQFRFDRRDIDWIICFKDAQIHQLYEFGIL